jgi:hypothetical protein
MGQCCSGGGHGLAPALLQVIDTLTIFLTQQSYPILERTYCLRDLIFAWILDCHFRASYYLRGFEEDFQSSGSKHQKTHEKTAYNFAWGYFLRGFLPRNFPWTYCLRGFSPAFNF